MREFRQLSIDAIHESATNPRRVFSEASLDELAASIRRRGVLQPILLRPLPEGEAGTYRGLVFCKPDGSQLMQRDILKHSLHPILKKLGLEQGGLNIFRRFRYSWSVT
jgi:hypothetical protein